MAVWASTPRPTDRWKRIATIQLPLAFEDYAGVAVAGDLIAVVSQQSSALWLGHLDPLTWTVDEGAVYHFPRDDDGEPRFEAVEGVAFLGANQVVVATDRRSPGRHPDTEQSVAVFDLPDRPAACPPARPPRPPGHPPARSRPDAQARRAGRRRRASAGGPARRSAHPLRSGGRARIPAPGPRRTSAGGRRRSPDPRWPPGRRSARPPASRRSPPDARSPAPRCIRHSCSCDTASPSEQRDRPPIVLASVGDGAGPSLARRRRCPGRPAASPAETATWDSTSPARSATAATTVGSAHSDPRRYSAERPG